MTEKEKAVVDKEKKQFQALIDSLRTENNAIGHELAKMIKLVANTRASQLGIDMMLTDLEEKLKK